MIVVDDKAICEAEEFDALRASASLCKYLSQGGVTLEEAVNALQVAIMDLSCPDPEQSPTKPLPATYHCRVCGRTYFFKGDARACEREHKRPWRR